ncbi:flavodoxin family protein [Planctobacterium marinum]|uniref:flavodoxin family protein n=1 Tax=Planctobacterium marinum TaxID=1631968 RepID=UPI001E2A870C|nr:NAD(P)H-dependent oxidoreductase [Planctobacterium marinum]MCC2607702.1 NAD(P)H-dependent oxidoreductase [Planctobacterium marinum]
MAKIGLVYFTNTDVTGKLCAEVQQRLEAMDFAVVAHRIDGNEIIQGRFKNEGLFDALFHCDAIIFGSPTYMGSVSAQFKAFADATSDFWQEQKWAGKLAAGITSGTAHNGDQASTLGYMQLLASQHGMLWVSLDAPFNDQTRGVNRLGCHLGVTAQSADGEVHNVDLKTAAYLAENVAKYVEKFRE